MDASVEVGSDLTPVGVVGFTSGAAGVVPRLVRVEDGRVRMVAVNVTDSTVRIDTDALVQVLVR